MAMPGRARSASTTRPAVSISDSPRRSSWRTRRPSSIQLKAVASSPKRATSTPSAARDGDAGAAAAGAMSAAAAASSALRENRLSAAWRGNSASTRDR